jgi:hypothetical protein
MRTLTMPQLKISKTKKRLSNDGFGSIALGCYALAGFFVMLCIILHQTPHKTPMGMVKAEFPVVSAIPLDPGTYRYREAASKTIAESSLVLLITRENIVFGDLKSFVSHQASEQRLLSVPHKHGSPQLHELTAFMPAWIEKQKSVIKKEFDGIAILASDPEVPLSIVVQTVHFLKESGIFTNVVIGGRIQ